DEVFRCACGEGPANQANARVLTTELQHQKTGAIQDANARLFKSESGTYAAVSHISAHQVSICFLMVSRMTRVLANFSSLLPVRAEGSGKLQCRRVVTLGKIGQRSALASSHTVMTYVKVCPDFI